MNKEQVGARIEEIGIIPAARVSSEPFGPTLSFGITPAAQQVTDVLISMIRKQKN